MYDESTLYAKHSITSLRYDRLGLDGIKKCSQYRPIVVTQFLPPTSVQKLQMHITRHRRYPFQIANNDQK